MAKPINDVGIVGYGAYVPRFRITAREIARVWAGGGAGPVEQKSVAGPDEDTITMTIEAGRNALRRAGLDGSALGAVWVGSESHPYAVKPSGTVVAEALGCTTHIHAADWEFACKAGTEALTAAMGMIASGLISYALAAGADTAQGRPGDALEYTAAAGAAALIVGPAEQAVARIEATVTYVSDTPDFFRRADRPYPVHGNRFTGEPAYFAHINAAGNQLLREIGAEPGDFRYLVLHQPNAKFPQVAAKQLGFTNEQIAPGLLSPRIGNTYSAAALLGLCATLDVAEPGDRIMVVSYGSGAGADGYALTVTEGIGEQRTRAPQTAAYVGREQQIDYATYARWRGKLVMD
jgi:hydroxymethylglutaryl-CoA synthase